MPSKAALAFLLSACAGGPAPLPLEEWMRVGVSMEEEAAAVQGTLEVAGWETAQRQRSELHVALAFRRGEQRAVRVVTARGVAVSLDSHEPDGVRVRHGNVSLFEREDADVDGDGRADVVVAREEDDVRCLVVIRFDDAGAAEVMADDAGALHEGACVGRFEDVDGDGHDEGIVSLLWPDLAIGTEVAGVDVPLARRDAAWRAEGMPVAYLDRERVARADALAVARGERDVGRAVRLAVEVAALAHLAGASLAAQVGRFDLALSGLVLSEAERDRVSAIRAVIAAGWRSTAP